MTRIQVERVALTTLGVQGLSTRQWLLLSQQEFPSPFDPAGTIHQANYATLHI
jgi:hypothetical protein